jgi:hypothetical protein
MTPGWWTELAVRQRIADLRREAAHERLLRSVRHGSQARHGGWVHRHGWVGRIRAASIRLQRRSSLPGPELLTQRGDRS